MTADASTTKTMQQRISLMNALVEKLFARTEKMKNDTEESLGEKLVLIFPEITARNRVIAVLNQYGTEPYEKEVVRVRLDILKLSGNSIDDVQRWVAIAKKDYRDILASAEYPSELLAPTWSMSKDETTII